MNYRKEFDQVIKVTMLCQAEIPQTLGYINYSY